MTEDDALSLQRVAEARSVVEARTAALRLRVRRGEVLLRRRVERAMVAEALGLRDRLMTGPARHAAILAAELRRPTPLVLVALERAMRRVLTRAADAGDAMLAAARSRSIPVMGGVTQ